MEEFGACLVKQASVYASTLLILILFFLIHFPFFFSSSLRLAFYLLLSAPQSSLSSSFLLFTLLFSQSSLPFRFFTSLHGFCFFDIPASSHPLLIPSFFFPSSVLPTPLKPAINSPVLFPLVVLKNVLWDGINQHQV